MVIVMVALAATADEAGLPAHVGQCLEVEGAPALWPWREVVRSAMAALAATADEA